jgi:hypothetical protein
MSSDALKQYEAAVAAEEAAWSALSAHSEPVPDPKLLNEWIDAVHRSDDIWADSQSMEWAS